MKYTFVASLLIGIAAITFPQIDIDISKLFYDSSQGFLYNQAMWVEVIFRGIPIITIIIVSFLILGISAKFFMCHNKSECLKSPLFFLLLTLSLGPGLCVNLILKENFGRARPREIIEFNGTKQFSPAGHYVSQCDTNCSFSSGHAAMGFYFTSLAWIVPLRKRALTFTLGTLFGTIVGVGRIAQGGHFFSDVIFSFIIVMIINEISFRIWKKAA